MSLPRYPKYKDSGVEWPGEVPEHWVVFPLKRDLEFLTSGSRGWAENYSDEGDLFIRIGNLTRDSIALDLSDVQRVVVPSGTEGARTIVRPGDILFSITAYLGSVAVVPDDIEIAYVSQHVALGRLRQKRLLPKWVAYLTLSNVGKAYLEAQAYGGTKIQLSLEDVANLVLTVPPLDEQVATAEFLDLETGKIDALIEDQRRLVELLDEKVKSIVLSSIDSAETQQLRLGQAAQVILRPVIQREGQPYTPIGLFNRGRGLFHKESREKDEMGDSDFFWIEEGDLVISGQFAWEGAVALAGKEETGCVVSHRYPVLRAKQGVALTEYLFALLSTSHGDFLLNENSRGAAGRNRPLNIDSLLKEKIPIPSIEIQLRIARAVHQRNKLLRETPLQFNLLQERRSALISAAVTGKIDVRGVATEEAA